jgi:hypothetical protein
MRRWLWFVAYYLAGLAVLAAIAALIRAAIA